MNKPYIHYVSARREHVKHACKWIVFFDHENSFD